MCGTEVESSVSMRHPDSGEGEKKQDVAKCQKYWMGPADGSG